MYKSVIAWKDGSVEIFDSYSQCTARAYELENMGFIMGLNFFMCCRYIPEEQLYGW